MSKLTIRQEVSKIVGFTFTSNNFSQMFKSLEKEGRLSLKEVLAILALLLEREAKREDDL